MDDRREAVLDGAVVGVLQELRGALDVDLGVGDDDLARAIEAETTHRGGGDLAGEALVADEPLEGHRPHPARFRDTACNVGELQLCSKVSARATRDEGVGAAEPGAGGVRRRADRAGTAAYDRCACQELSLMLTGTEASQIATTVRPRSRPPGCRSSGREAT